MSQEILVTGANRGIGLELARQLSERGHTVTATCRDPEAQGARELQGLGVEVRRLDVTDGNAIRELARDTADRPLEILINNAGVGVYGPLLGDLDYQQVRLYFETNALAPLRLTEALVPRLRLGRRKLVANMTSRMGSVGDNSSGGSYAYRASKAALNMITRCLAVDLADEGIHAVVLHPGWVQTDMGGSSARTSVQDCVAALLRVLEGVGPEQSGRFFDFAGQEVPW